MRQKMNLAVVLLSSLSLQGPSHYSYNLQFCSHLEAFAPCVWNTLCQSLQGQFFFPLHHSETCFNTSSETLFLTPTQSISHAPSLSLSACVSVCLIEEHLIYNVALGSGVQQSDSVLLTCTCFLDSFSLQGMYIFAFTRSISNVLKLPSFFACLTGLSPSSSMSARNFFAYSPSFHLCL